MNAVEFIIRMRDQASTTLDRIGREFGSARADADRLSGSLDTASVRAGRLRSSLKDAFMSIPGASLLTNPFILIGAGAAAATKLGIENEKASVSFEVLLGSASKAASMLSEINKYADKTPYEKMGLRDAVKLMLSFNVAQERVIPTMKMLGDIAMGDKNKLNSLALAYSQMSSAGRLNGQDLLQMINAGFNPLNEIAKMTGKSMAVLRKEMEGGRISSQMVEQAFINATSAGGLFYNMTERMGKIAGGKLSTLIDTAKNRLLDLYGVIEPVLVPAIDLFSTGLEILGYPLNWIVKSLSWLVGEIRTGNPLLLALVAGIGAFTIATNASAIAMTAVSIGAKAAAIGTKIWAGAQWLLNVAMAASPLTWIITAVVAVGTAAVFAFQKIGWFRGIILASWEVIKGMGKLLKDFLLDRITGIVSGIGKLGKALVYLFKGDFKQAWQTAKDAGKDMSGAGAFAGAVNNAKSMGAAAGAAYQKGVLDVNKKKLANNQTLPTTSASGIVNPSVTQTTVNPASTKGATSVASGGSRSTNVTINLRSMIEQVVYNGSSSENKEDLVKTVEEVLVRALQAAGGVS